MNFMPIYFSHRIKIEYFGINGDSGLEIVHKYIDYI